MVKFFATYNLFQLKLRHSIAIPYKLFENKKDNYVNNTTAAAVEFYGYFYSKSRALQKL